MRIKGFDENLRCRGFQFEIGKEYKIENNKPLELCTDSVFHYCDSLQVMDFYYSCDKGTNRYCVIEVLGKEITNGEIYGSNHIKIVREIKGEELDILLGKIAGNTGLFNSGDRNSGDRNSGDYNSGRHNSGDYNSGNRNSGDYNSGNYNSGYYNSGVRNSGDYNRGSFNSGDWNYCDRSNGYFNSVDDDNVRIFNKPSGMSARKFRLSVFYKALESVPFILTEWIEYTDEEKKEDINKAFAEGYLKTYTYEEACANWWSKMTDENKAIIMSMPNFDKDIFFKITGIKL